MFSVIQMVRRLGRQRLVSASIMLGIALTIALGVAVPLAIGALASLGLRASIEALPPASRHLQLVRQTIPFDPPLQEHIRQHLGDLLADDYTMSYLPPLQARRETPLLNRPVRLRTQGDLMEHIVMVGGTSQPDLTPERRSAQPACAVSSAIPAPIKVLLSAQQLEASSFGVGDQLCVADMFLATIAGSFVPKNLDDPYWFGDLRPIQGESSPDESLIVLMLTADDFYTIWLRLFSKAPVTHFYRGSARGSTITLDTLDDVADRLGRFRAELAAIQPQSVLLQTGLEDAIMTFTTRFRLLQSVLIALLLMLVILVMIYVMLVGALATQQQSNEIALLRSRGATRRQILGAQVGQALVLAVPAIALGLGFGILGVLLLGRTALFQRLGGGAAVELRFTPASWLLPGTMLLVALIGLAFAARPALTQSQVTLREEQARPPRGAGWRRAQIEGLLVLFAALGLQQLWRYEGSLTTMPDGAIRFNLLVLATPSMLLIAGSLLFLRVFPLAVGGLGWLLGRRRGIVSALSSWQLARNPVLYGRLVLLLTLTIGLGVYSQTVTSTIIQADLRQALDEVGADVRVALEPNDDLGATLATIPAAAHTVLSRVAADRLVQQGSAHQQGTIPLLGVDGAALSSVLALSGSDDTPLMAALRRLGTAAAPPLGLALPPNAEALTIQLKGDVRDVTVFAKFGGSNGEREVALGQPGATWQELEAAIPSDLRPPFTLQALIVAPGTESPSAGGQWLAFDRITARTGTARVPLQGFDRIDAWEALGSVAGEAQVRSSSGVSSGSGAAELHVGVLPPGHWAALRFRVPLSILADTVQGAGGVQTSLDQPVLLRIGGQRIEATVRQQLGRFPGVDGGQTVLITDRERLASLLSYGQPTAAGPVNIQYGLPIPLWPTELRVALRPGVQARLGPNAITKAMVLLAQAADPLRNGVRVILLLGFGCALILSMIGFLIYSALMVQARRLDWAVLSVLGLSRRQLLMVIAAEQGFVLSGSLFAGAVVGLLLAATTGSFLRVVTGTVLVPAGVAWQSYLPLVGGLSVALAATLVLLLAHVHRRGMTRVLRLGEG